VALSWSASVQAQGFRVTGRVVHVSQEDSTPVADQWIVLHSVTPTSGAAIDSQRTDSRGTYRVRAARRDTLASYLVSVTYQGITYFADPLPGRGPMRDPAQTLFVYDTSSTAPTIELAQRHVVVRAPEDDGSRRVIELLVLENRGVRTRVTNDTAQPVWEGAIPGEAVSFEVGETDVSPEAVLRRGDRVAVVAPVAPGERQLLIGYVLPASERELVVPLDQPVGRLSVLLEDSAAIVVGGALEFRGMETLGDLVLRSYGAELVAEGTAVSVRFPRGRRSFGDLWWLYMGIAFLALAGGLVWWWRTGSAGARLDDPELLAARIAELDRQFAGREDEEYQRERAVLKQRLGAALARRETGR
jgi:hypothetical protein